MQKYIKLFIILLAIPFIGFAVLFYAENKFDAILTESMAQEPAPSGQSIGEQLNKYSSKAFCKTETARIVFDDFCGDINNINYAKITALSSAVLALLFVFLITRLGKKAAKNRDILLSYFKPALYFTALITIALLLLNIWVLIAAVYYGEIAAFNSWHPKILVILGLAVMVGFYIVAHSLWSSLKKPVNAPLAMLITKEQNPQIWHMVEEIAQKLNIAPPANIIAGLDDNFYVTQADTEIPEGSFKGQTLYLSLPFCRILTKDELKSIIGHELAHFAGDDAAYSTKFYPIYFCAANAVEMMGRQSAGSVLFALALMTPKAVFDFFLAEFTKLESQISRQRELLADATSAKISGGLNNASSLIKAHAYGMSFSDMRLAAQNAVAEGKAIINHSAHYRAVAENLPQSAALQTIKELDCAVQNDSHPTLSERIKNIGINYEEALAKGLKLPEKEEAAISLFTNYDETEQQLSYIQNCIILKYYADSAKN